MGVFHVLQVVYVWTDLQRAISTFTTLKWPLWTLSPYIQNCIYVLYSCTIVATNQASERLQNRIPHALAWARLPGSSFDCLIEDGRVMICYAPTWAGYSCLLHVISRHEQSEAHSACIMLVHVLNREGSIRCRMLLVVRSGNTMIGRTLYILL